MSPIRTLLSSFLIGLGVFLLLDRFGFAPAQWIETSCGCLLQAWTHYQCNTDDDEDHRPVVLKPEPRIEILQKKQPTKDDKNNTADGPAPTHIAPCRPTTSLIRMLFVHHSHLISAYSLRPTAYYRSSLFLPTSYSEPLPAIFQHSPCRLRSQSDILRYTSPRRQSARRQIARATPRESHSRIAAVWLRPGGSW